MLRAESRWAMLTAAVIVFLLAMVVFTALHWASMPPSRVETIDPRTLHLRGEFIESDLGTGLDAQGRVTVHLLAQQYSFRPSCIVVPSGTAVTFRTTSTDVVHGMQIMGSNINTMLVPGYVSTFITTLDGEGERLIAAAEVTGILGGYCRQPRWRDNHSEQHIRRGAKWSLDVVEFPGMDACSEQSTPAC